MAWFEHNGSTIFYEEEGAGEPVLLMPGWGGSIQEFLSLRAALLPGHRVISADLPGSGRSGPQPRDYTASYLRDDTASFIAFIEHLSAGPTNLIGSAMAARSPCSWLSSSQGWRAGS